MNKNDMLNTVIFRGMTEKELAAALKSLNARTKNFERDEIIFMAGDQIKEFGMILEGAVNIETIDFMGERQIINHITIGDIFGETYAYITQVPIPVEAVAVKKTRVLFLDGNLWDEKELLFNRNKGIFKDDISYQIKSWQLKFYENLLQNSMKKCMALSSRIFHTGPKSVRGRICAYLNSQSIQHGKKEFNIPFNRQEMADYLNLDRTALSKELGKMSMEGIIEFRKNHFKLLDMDIL